MTGKTPVAWVIGLAVVVLAVLASLGWRYSRPSAPPPVATATAPVREAPPAAAPAKVDAAAESQQPAPAPSSPTPPSAAAAPPAPAANPAAPAATPPQPPATARNGAEGQANGQEPQFDVVRVQPSGDTVVAGRTRPGAKVALLAGPRRIGEATADAGGQFVILPEPLPVGEHVLALELQMPGQEPVLSRQNVAVRLPGQGQGEVIVALTQPDAPTRILSDAAPSLPATASAAPPAAPAEPQRTADAPAATPPAAASTPASALAVRTVEAEDSGAFFATGTAPPGAQVRLYLNDTMVATVTADPAGAWSLRVQKGMNAGNYSVRADQVDARNGQVTGRVEVPFAYPEPATRVAAAVPQAGAAVAQSASGASAAGSASGASASAAVVPSNAAPAIGAPSGTASAPASSVAVPSAASGPVTGQGAVAAATPPSAAVVADLKTATVARGDSLWRISRQVYGRGIRYTQIYEANTDQIRNPRLIYPGQIFVLPQTD